MASAGIELWRIQLHGRWGSQAVLRYTRLAPLTAGLSKEASLGRDLGAMQDAILQAKSRLASLHTESPRPSDAAIHEAIEDTLQAGGKVGPMHSPSMTQILQCRTKKLWSRDPVINEILPISRSTKRAHALRPPQVSHGQDLGEHLQSLLDTQSAITWCGWQFDSRDSKLDVFKTGLSYTWCRKCWGKQSKQITLTATHSSGSSSSSSSSD